MSQHDMVLGIPHRIRGNQYRSLVVERVTTLYGFTIREIAESLINDGTGLSSAYPVGSKIADKARMIIHELDAAETEYVWEYPEPYARQIRMRRILDPEVKND